jgi:hypothetical protein
MVWLAAAVAVVAQTPSSPPPAGNQLSPLQMWVLIGLSGAAIVYIAILRPMMKRNKDPLDRPSGFASISQQRGVERQMQNLLVELSEMSRQITAQLDTRAQKLELLIKDADDRLAQLRAATSNNTGGTAQPFSVPSSQSLSSPPQPESVTTSFSHPPMGDESDPRHADVYSLADQGRDAYEIAAQLGRPRGEVELILALRSKG